MAYGDYADWSNGYDPTGGVPGGGGTSGTEPVGDPGKVQLPGPTGPVGTPRQVATAPDGVPYYQDQAGSYWTKNPDGSWAQQTLDPSAWATGGTGGGGGGGGGGLINPFPGQFQPPGTNPYPTAPTFSGGPAYTPPPAFSYDPFKAPTFEEAQNDPGFQFVQQLGQQGVERSAAARGVLNSGGTLQDIAKWNQSLAESQYGNVFNRDLGAWQQNLGAALNAYNTNYQTQYADPYKNAYQSALDQFNPQFSAWQTNMGATQRDNEFNYSSAFDRYKFDYQRWYDQHRLSMDMVNM